MIRVEVTVQQTLVVDVPAATPKLAEMAVEANWWLLYARMAKRKDGTDDVVVKVEAR